MDLFEPVYIVRSELFGADFAPKLWLSLLTLGLVLWDSFEECRLDYAWVMLTGTVVWSIAEFAMQVLGVREMPNRELFGTNLPLWVAIMLQGVSEGAFLVIYGLFVGDRLIKKEKRLQTLSLFLLLCAYLLWRVFFPGLDVVGAAASRRNIMDGLALPFLGAAIFFDVYFLVKFKQHRQRALLAFVSIVVLASIWTIAQVLTGNRWVEITVPLTGAVVRASDSILMLVLVYDVLVEIGLAYLPFFAIPVVFKLIGRSKLSFDLN